ncbi:MAG: 5-oxoprolinase [Alphaproteobacteria bacterium]|nr:5-oxoprolinase [Alphaproteobacteria bacterium]
MDEARYEFWIDRGGTFTDVIARAEDGTTETLKLLSENPGAYDDAALAAIRRVLKIGSSAAIPPARVLAVKMGTTVATNALLEHKGAPTLLITTKGFADQLKIGNQARPKLFVRRIDLPEMLYADVVEADERVTADGEILKALDEAALAGDLKAARAKGLTACAIVFLHGYRYPEHERRAAALARAAGFTQVSVSHEAIPLPKVVSRGDTTVADAYLSPVLRTYVDRVAGALGGVPLYFMQSNGGLADAKRFEGKDAILSGPAGGIVGMARTAEAAGFPRAIGFDMGGTSTDVALYNGAFERVNETEIAGVRIKTPMLSVHTVAAGGGSILHADELGVRVGPDSAGANPGPCAYRRGGPLTVTDANVMVGKLVPDLFPKIFGPNGDQPLDAQTVRARFAELAARIGKESPEAVADGFLRIAVENMAAAIRRVSIARGHDVTTYALNSFGGAGGQHACRVADVLGIERVLIHPLSSLLSAYGIGIAPVRAIRTEAVGQGYEAAMKTFPEALARLEKAASDEVAAQGVDLERITRRARLHLRYDGTDTTLPVDWTSAEETAEAFETQHRRIFGFGFEGRPRILEAIEVEASGEVANESDSAAANVELRQGAPRTTPIFTGGAWHDAPVRARETIGLDERIAGPALVIEPHQTVMVEPGWSLMRTARDDLLLTRTSARARRRETTTADPILIEVFNNLFMAIAEEMGVTLQNTATSVNIKERLDFSCAVFDEAGNLIANAPHMPVHLGSMGDSVAAVATAHAGNIHPGDVFALNAPTRGGTHLPDITVVMPVFDRAGERLRFWTAARGHHADIGGLTPGSMPPFSKTLDEEGAVLDALRIVEGGTFKEAEIRAAFTGARYPSRNPDQNIADLKAQIAACKRGERELQRACAEHGEDIVVAYMGHVQDHAEDAVRQVIDRLSDGAFTAEMDDGALIKVAVTIDRASRAARIDFEGTSAERASNFNAPASVTKAAVLYVFRCLVDVDIPLNAGCLRPLTIAIPDGSMLKPGAAAAVVAGNVETSQAIVDALFAALGAMAAAQGTMNNLTFGDARRQYYETICGGAGAGPDFDGASGVHTHMTNSRLTDPEILEARFPVLVTRFGLRANSGGAGAHRGGDGVVRELMFREAMDVSILSTRRRTAPFGLAGGGNGALGRNTLIRKDGREESLRGCDTASVAPGDRIRIETPGGGGFGAAPQSHDRNPPKE